MPANTQKLVFAQTVVCDGTTYRPKEDVPDTIPEAMLKVWVEQGLVRDANAPSTIPDTTHIDPAGKARIDAERDKVAAKAAAAKADADAAEAGHPVRLTPDKALDPGLVEGLDIDELNVLAAERGYDGDAFKEIDRAINFLSANFPR